MKSARRWRTASEFFSGETKERKKQTIEKENNRKKSLGKSLDRAEKDREEKESFFHSTFLKS